MDVITFSEFLERWDQGERLIAPKDYKTRPHDQIGIIDCGYFYKLSFSDKAREACKRKE